MKIKFRPKVVIVSVLALAALVGAPAAVLAGFSPSARPTYQCITPTNCPGADHVTFNSFTNAPNYGDERAFFDGKDAGDTSANGYKDSIDVHNGQKLTLRMYVHNNANPNAIGEAAATAHNTRVQVLLPTSKRTSTSAAALVSADNANPGTVSDTVDLKGANPFTVAFDQSQPVQVTYRPNGTGAYVTKTLPSAAFADAATLNAAIGDWKGCFEFSALITMTVKIKMDTPPPPVKPEYSCDLFDIKADVNRSVKVTSFVTSAKNGAVFKNAVIDWGDNSAPTTATDLVGQTHQYAADGTYTIKATAHFTVDGKDVTATSASCQKPVTFKPNQPPEKPEYTCDKFEIKSDESTRTVNVTAFATTAKNGAVFKNAVIDWGDSSTPTTATNLVGQTHKYAADGTYTIKTTAHFTVDGQDVTATSESCQKQVKFTSTPPPPEKPVYSCDKFNIKAETGRMVKVTDFAVTAKNGATLKQATIDWGDSTPTTTVNNASGVVGQTHQYAKDGTFTITTIATFLVDGKEVSAGGPQCEQHVTFTPNKPPEVPEFTCDKFDIKAESTERTIKVTALDTIAKNGATFANAVIDWGDGTAPLTTNTAVGQTHKFDKDGTYLVKATAHFTVDGKDVVASSVKCQQQVTFAPNVPPVITPPPTTPAPPAALVNTGAGENLAALFAAVTAAGMIVYRRLLTRRLNG